LRNGERRRGVLSTKKCVLLDVHGGPVGRRAGARWSTKVCEREGEGVVRTTRRDARDEGEPNSWGE